MWPGQDINHKSERGLHVERPAAVSATFSGFAQNVRETAGKRNIRPNLTFGVVTLGLLPPMAPGRMEPVSL